MKLEIGSELFRKLWLRYLKKNYKMKYTRTGFGWVKKKTTPTQQSE